MIISNQRPYVIKELIIKPVQLYYHCEGLFSLFENLCDISSYYDEIPEEEVKEDNEE